MKHEILLVDAERLSTRVVELALRRAGYRVRMAGSGVEALEKIESAMPDVLVIDSQLPKLDGYSLVQRLREGPETARIPVVALTRPSENADRWRALGVEERLLKPVFVREIVACVGLLVARSARARIAAGMSASRSGVMSGSTEDLATVDLLQAFEMLRESGVLRLTRHGQQAEIQFRDGRAVDATLAGRLRGERAVYAVIGWDDAEFELEFKPVVADDVIDLSTGTLLTEAMRRLGESGGTQDESTGIDGARLGSPSSRPWTSDIGADADFSFDDDGAARRLPRKVSRAAKRVVTASVAVAGLICILAAVRTMTARRDRMTEDARRLEMGSPALLARAAPPAAEAPEVGRTAAAAGIPEKETAGIPENEIAEAKPAPDVAPPAVDRVAAVDGAKAAGGTERSHDDPVVSRPAVGRAAVEARAPIAVSGPATGAALESPAALVKEAEQALLQGANERAVLLATEAVATSPADAAGWLVLASAHRAMGEDDAARSDYRQCVAQAQTAGVNDCRILAEK